jgi:hypothetical protein
MINWFSSTWYGENLSSNKQSIYILIQGSMIEKLALQQSWNLVWNCHYDRHPQLNSHFHDFFLHTNTSNVSPNTIFAPRLTNFQKKIYQMFHMLLQKKNSMNFCCCHKPILRFNIDQQIVNPQLKKASWKPLKQLDHFDEIQPNSFLLKLYSCTIRIETQLGMQLCSSEICQQFKWAISHVVFWIPSSHNTYNQYKIHMEIYYKEGSYHIYININLWIQGTTIHPWYWNSNSPTLGLLYTPKFSQVVVKKSGYHPRQQFLSLDICTYKILQHVYKHTLKRKTFSHCSYMVKHIP